MPVCKKCGRISSSADMRRWRDTWMCIETYPCQQRVKEQKKMKLAKEANERG